MAARAGLALLLLFLLLAPACLAAQAQTTQAQTTQPGSAPDIPGFHASGATAAGPLAISDASVSKALADAETSLLPALGSKDFESRLAKTAAELSPADAASVEEYFASRVGDAEAKGRILSGAADLRLLLGQFAVAAADMENSAVPSGPGVSAVDATRSLRAARLWLAAGENDRAARLAAVVIVSSKDPRIVDEARLVSAWASLLSGSRASAIALAGTIAGPASGEPGPDSLRREAVFLLWAAGDATTRDTESMFLATNWPESPEAKIAAQSPGVSLMALPHWYLGGIALLPEKPEAEGEPGGSRTAPTTSAQGLATPSTRSATPASAIPTPGAVSNAASSQPEAAPRYQVGVFSSRDHAQALVDELSKKGFVAKIEERNVGDQTLLSVVLSPKDNKDHLAERLKDAGYEAWLLVD